MRGAAKLTAADMRRWRERCPRKGCDGFLCTVGLDIRYSYKQCNDCNAVVSYHAGDYRISRKEYEAAARRFEEKQRRRAATSVPMSEGHLVEEDETMTRVKAKGKAVKKGSKPKKAKKTAAKKAPGKVAAPREGTLGAFVVDMIKKGATVEATSKAAVKKFPDKKSALPAGVRWYAWRHGVKAKPKS